MTTRRQLQLDLGRLPSRNLGRDDRVISSNARETRYPFLDLSFVAFVASVPVFLKMDPTMDMNGVGDKLLLREAARSLGLVKAASRRKRAMQFGSRSARMTENAEERRGDATLGSRTHSDNSKAQEVRCKLISLNRLGCSSFITHGHIEQLSASSVRW
jgi:asparagine synthetase B (glutamine-hydrolysing)